MSDRKSAAEIEREVEAQRAGIDDTMEALRDRLSPQAAVDYGLDYLRGDGGRRLMRAVRENPLAAGLAAAGIGWLLYTASRSGRGAVDHHYDPSTGTRLTYPGSETGPARPLPGASAAAPGNPAPPLRTMTEREAREARDTQNRHEGPNRHEGMMGDGTEEQNLGQPGVPGARIGRDDAAAAFGEKVPGDRTA